MTPEDIEKHIKWLQHADLKSFLKSREIPHPWFTAYLMDNAPNHRITLFSALVPIRKIPVFLKKDSWDLPLGGGSPSAWIKYSKGKVSRRVYCPFGNEDGIEPIVFYRSFNGVKKAFIEVSQEFCRYHKLYQEHTKNRFLIFNDDGDESEAIRYKDNTVEIRTDLLTRFCAIKQMSLAIYIENFRFSEHDLQQLGIKEKRLSITGKKYQYKIFIGKDDDPEKKFMTVGSIRGKKYILPGPMPSEDVGRREENYQEFIIGADARGKLIKHSCDPEQLDNNFGNKPGAPHYLTPVFFRTDVLSKYYEDPQKYSVGDGYVRCSGGWVLRLDNDHSDYVVVYLGDLGQDLSESERYNWLSSNIPPAGRKISSTNYQRAILGKFTDPQKPDFVFKQEYARFNEEFRKAYGWDFFLPLHKDDEHFLKSLRTLSKDNQSEFDQQLLALTKIIVDSINEKEISKGLKSLAPNDKSINKLEKYFKGSAFSNFEEHIKYLRVLQDLRSKSAAHRKGNNYDDLIKELNIPNEGQQRVFNNLLVIAIEFIGYLHNSLLAIAECPAEK
ncbi:MAG: hypothetical protein PHE84_00250 [bacterium]|nr:hypothetical protein [bacterium]